MGGRWLAWRDGVMATENREESSEQRAERAGHQGKAQAVRMARMRDYAACQRAANVLISVLDTRLPFRASRAFGDPSEGPVGASDVRRAPLHHQSLPQLVKCNESRLSSGLAGVSTAQSGIAALSGQLSPLKTGRKQLC